MTTLGRSSPRLLCALAILCFASAAFAQTAHLKFTTSGGPNYGGVVINPYTAEINGVSTTVICNDFTSETYFGEEWDATVTNLSDSAVTTAATRWGTTPGSLQNYYAVAYLSVLLLAETDLHNKAVLSFAIWSIFAADGPNGVDSFLAGDPILGEVHTAVSDALAAVGSTPNAPNFNPANVSIYTYDGNGTTCPTGSCPPPPQEFIVVRTPEPSAIGIMLFDLLALAAFCFVVLRGRRLPLFSRA